MKKKVASASPVEAARANAKKPGRPARPLPENVGWKLLRRDVVLAKVDLGSTTLDEAMARGDFPRPISLTDGGRAVGWVEAEVDAWLASRLAKRDAERAA